MNRKNVTRNALFTSILSLLLCVSMLVGTSFAWFTDSVDSGRNTITAGRLDIELYNDIQKNAEKKVSSETVLFDNLDGDKWEPGVVAWENLTVVNEGDLALKYTLVLNVLSQTETTVGETTYKLSDAIKVGVVDNGITATDRSGVINAVTSWVTLTEFALNMNNLKLTAGATDTFGIVLYWQPGENDNIFNLNNDRLTAAALELEIGVALTATQVEEESDSFGDNYDANAGKAETEPTEPVQTPAQKLQAALNAGGTVVLEDNIELAAGESLSITNNVTLDLNGKTITAAGDALVVTNGATLILNGNGTVAAGTSGVGSANAVWANGGNVVINGGTYSVGGDSEAAAESPTHQNDVIYTKNSGTVTINGGTFLNDGTVWTLNENDSNRNTITVYGGTFQGWNPADNVSEGANTNFVAEGYEATAETKDGETWYTVAEKAAEPEPTDPEPVTVYGTIDADTYVTSGNKETDYSDSEELSVRTGGASGNVYYRTYFQVNISDIIVAAEGFNKDNATVTFTFTISNGSADNNTNFTLKAFAAVDELDFSKLVWKEVANGGEYADELGWANGTELSPTISVENNKITITVDYSAIEGKAIFALTSNSSDLKVASLESTNVETPTVSVTYTPTAE